MSSETTAVEWLTLLVAAVAGFTGVLSLLLSRETAKSARRVEIHLARREHHHKEFARLMRTAEELDAAATHFRGEGSFGGPQEEERSARFEDALTAYRAAYDDVEAIAPAEVRDAVTELGNAARALTRDPSYGPHMVEARDKLNRAIWRELGTDELE